MGMMCITCSLDFPTDADFLVHKKSGHTDMTKGTPLDGPSAVVVGPDIKPTEEFAAQVARIEAKANEPPPAPPKPNFPERPILPDPKPITLTYNYIGECPTCRNPVSTLELDVAKVHCVVAFCARCNKQLASREEKKL